MRASLASLLVTSLVLSSATASAGGRKRRPKTPKSPKTPPAAPAPAPEPAPTPGLGDPAAQGTTPAPAPAAPPAPASAEAKAQAKALVKEATKLYNVQQYEKSAELYQQAYLLDQNPAYLYASAQSQRLGGDCVKALQSYQAYLRASPPEDQRAKATANIERCEQEIREREAAVNADQINTPYVVPAPPEPPPPEVRAPLPPPPPPPGKTYMLGHVMLGVGVIAIGGGSYLFYSGRSTLADHNSAPTYDEYIDGLADVDSAKQKQKIGLIAVGGGAALVGGAILFYVLHSRSGGEESPPPVQASVSAQGASVIFTRKF